MQAKSIHAESGEVRMVSNEWAAHVEQRGSSIAASVWEASTGLTLGSETLDGTSAAALVTVSDCGGTITNTITLANGEKLEAWREIIV